MATLPSDIQNEQPDGIAVRIASLTDEGQAQVVEALEAAAADGALDEDAFQEAVGNAESADESRANVEGYREQQAEAAEAGDYDKAQEFANKSEYELREIDDLGGSEAAGEVIEAQTDQMELAEADSYQDAAQDNANFAMSDNGTEAQREAAAETAADYAATSAQYGAQADAGGTYGDHSYDATVNDAPDAMDTAGTEG